VGKGDDRDVVFINTAFSCLCRRSDVHSFAPIWRPSFIAQFEPGDSCHINGMAVKDDMIAYVTALGETNQPGQWRENKKDGGIVIDIATGQPIIRGLSMPHSPRWYAGRWWLLESGMGSFGTFDPIAGTYTSIVQLPGFTRGLSFAGPFAFIGLSQVRESAVFGGVPIAERTLEERNCGVWVVNIESGTASSNRTNPTTVPDSMMPCKRFFQWRCCRTNVVQIWSTTTRMSLAAPSTCPSRHSWMFRKKCEVECRRTSQMVFERFLFASTEFLGSTHLKSIQQHRSGHLIAHQSLCFGVAAG
ncbi:MAG: TIGR03032 family protein, partial [Planctomycetota bacterium]